MIINNKSVIERINNAIISYNKESKDEQINLITNGEVKEEDLKKIKLLYIDIGDISKEEINTFFEELANVLEVMKLKGLYIYAHNENVISDVDMTFLSRVNRELKDLQISNIDLSNVDENVFNQFENLEVLILGKNNINDFELISKLNEGLAVDVGNNPMSNVSINEVVNEFNKHHGKIAFNEHPFLNSIVFALEDKQINFDSRIPQNRMEEMLQFCRDYKIVPIVPYKKVEDYKKIKNEFQIPINIIISGTKEMSIEFLQKHPEISSIKIIDEENRENSYQEEPYSREDFIKIKQKIEEIKQQIQIPDELDKDREKKIFMQVYIVLGKMIDYNHFAATKEGEKDENLMITCRNLKDGLLEGKAVCAGYADILKNVLGEFGIKAQYVYREPEDKEIYAEKKGYQYEVKMDELLGFEKTDIDEFVKSYGYQDEHGHAWNSVILDGKKYLCDLTWDAGDIKIGYFPLAFCCSSLDEFNSLMGFSTHDMFKVIDEGEISVFSSEDQLRFLGFNEEEIDKELHSTIEDMLDLIEECANKRKLETCAVSLSSEIKSSDFDGIDKAFNDREKEGKKGYDK